MTAVRPLFRDANGATYAANPTADEFAIGKITVNGIGGVAIDLQGQRLTGLPMPTLPGDPVTKQYQDQGSAGIEQKASVLAMADANVTLSGLQTINGRSIPDGGRVLLPKQTDPKENGFWVVHSGAWTRPDDFAVGTNANGAFALITGGNDYKNEIWSCISPDGVDIVGTDPLVIEQLHAFPEIGATGTGLSYTNGVFNLNYGVATSEGTNGIDVRYANGLGIDGSNKLQVVAVGDSPIVVGAQGVDFQFDTDVFEKSGNALFLKSLPATNNLNHLIGNRSADDLHRHKSNRYEMTNGSVDLPAGTPVTLDGSGLLKKATAASLADSQVYGITEGAILAGQKGWVCVGGIAEIAGGSFAPNQEYILSVSGGLQDNSNPPSGTGQVFKRIGYGISATLFLIDKELYVVRS